MTDYLIIKDPSSLDKNKWINFVQSHPHGNIFQLPEMFTLYKSTYGNQPVFLGCLDNAGALSGLIVGVIQGSKLPLVHSFTARCIIWGGPLVEDNSAIITELLLYELNKLFSKKTVYIEFRNLWDVTELKRSFINMNYQYEDHLNVLINLKKGKDLLWEGMHATRKKQIRRSNNRGCYVEVRDSLDQISLHKCFILLERTYKGAGLPFPAEIFFQNAFDQLKDKLIIKVFCAKFEGEIIAFRFVLAYKDVLYDWYAAGDRNHHDKYANDLLPWEILIWGIENNYSIFDFGGAGKPNKKYGVRDYKMKFGGELVNYGRYNKINKPIIFQLGEKALKTFQYFKSISKQKKYAPKASV